MQSQKEPLISIIIPVYNVENYLRKCIDSVLRQSFKNFELLLVDDGSTDNCAAICDEYVIKDPRVRVFHKKNSGVSETRNAGIRSAVGRYLLFIDGDDFIADGSLLNVVELLKTDGETDVVLFNVACFYNDGTIEEFNGIFKKDKLYKKSRLDALDFLTSLSNFSTSVCLKLIKRELVISNKIFFDKFIWGEDTDFCMKLYLCAETYNYCDSYIYYYRKGRDGSATYSFDSRKISDLLLVIARWIKEAENNPAYSQLIYRFFSFQYCLLLSGYSKLTRSVQIKYKEDVKKYSWLLKKSNDRRVSLVGIFYSIFGLRISSFLLNVYERLRKL